MSCTFKSASFYKIKNSLPSAAAKNQSRMDDTKRKRGLAHLKFRNIQESPDMEDPPVQPKVSDDRKVWLNKWREEKKKRLEEEKKKKKPVFKAGVVSHSIGSPYCKMKLEPMKKPKFQFRLPTSIIVPKLTIPVPPKFCDRKTQCKAIPSIENKRVLRSNVAKENIVPAIDQSKKVLRSKIVDPAQVQLLKKETEKVLNARVKTPSPEKVLSNITNVTEQPLAKNLIFSPFSPNVCITRGKRRPIVRSSDESDSEDQKLKKERRFKARIANTHFNQLDHETKRLHSCCDKWNDATKTENLPEDIISEIDALNGKTRLLTSDKFMQFRRLVEQFESGTAVPPITPEDLTGFWEMVYLQVEDLDQKFKKLDELKNNEWKDVSEVKFTNRPRKTIQKPPSKIIKKPAASSSLKNFLAAARKNKETPALAKEELKTFDGGSFQILSPVVKPSTPRQKSVLNSSSLRPTPSSGPKRISPRFSAINAMRKSILARSISSSPAVIMNENEINPRSILRKSSFFVTTTPNTDGNRKKALRFGPPEFRSPSSGCESSLNCSSEPVVKKQKKIVGTPYKQVSLNETFSMDEDESPSPNLSKHEPPSHDTIMTTPVRRSSRLQRENETPNTNSRCGEEHPTPFRRSLRLSQK